MTRTCIVTIDPCFSKVLERLTYNRLNSYIKKFNLLTDTQYGFRENRSTNMAISTLFDSLVTNMDNGLITGGIFLDLSKAFDTVNHEILLRKLSHYGIRGISNHWFKSSLSNRTQFVKYNSVESSTISVSCGVPQGSILGPLLFLIYINDLTNVSNILKAILFADDTNLFYSHKDIRNLKSTLNNELIKISEWFKANKLSLNADKSHYMLFGQNTSLQNIIIKIDNNIISKVNKIKFLGVIIDEKLNWKSHIELITTRVSRGIGILNKASKFLPTHILPTIYSTLVLPHLQYCNLTWGKNYNIRLYALHLLQKMAIRIINRAGYLDHSLPLFKKSKQLTIFDINKLQIASLMYKIL